MSNHIIETSDKQITIVIQNEGCIHCERFNESAELCGLYNTRPPARIIAIDGCPQFVPIIPF